MSLASTSPVAAVSSLVVAASSAATGAGLVTASDTGTVTCAPLGSVAVMVKGYTPSPLGPPCEASFGAVPLIWPLFGSIDSQAGRPLAL